MSDEDFLSRWSRRKQEATQAARTVDRETKAIAVEPASPAIEKQADPTVAPKEGEEPFDLSTLPPLDSITAVTDVTAFLREGVPVELTRAALRRAWVTDPLIRDFIGPAENAWDFNDPNAMPGFGPLDETPEQVRQWVERIVGSAREKAEQLVVSGPEDHPLESSAQKKTFSTESGASAQVPPSAEGPETAAIGEDHAPACLAAPDDGEAVPGGTRIVRRTHGGALPR